MCKNCGCEHGRKQCRAFRKQCNFCKKMNHFESCCLLKKKGGKRVLGKKVHAVEQESDDDFFIGSIEHEEKTNTAFAHVEINEGDQTTKVRFDRHRGSGKYSTIEDIQQKDKQTSAT